MVSKDEATASASVLPATTVWTVELPSTPLAGGSIDAKHVYVSLTSGRVVALARSSGNVVWSQEVSTSWPPLPREGSVYLATPAALDERDAASGRPIRRVPLPAPPTGPMTLAGELLLVPIEPHQLIAVRLIDGQIQWTASLGAESRLPGAVDHDVAAVYQALDDGQVVALSLATGAPLWRATGLGRGLTSPVAARRRVFVGSASNLFFALDAGSGRQVWYRSAGGDVIGAATIDDLVYYASLDNTLQAVSRDSGNTRWIRTLTTRPTSAPQVAGSELIVFGIRPRLVVLDARTGEPGKTLELEPEVEGALLKGPPLVIVDGSDADAGANIILIMRGGAVVGLRSGPATGAEVPDAGDVVPPKDAR